MEFGKVAQPSGDPRWKMVNATMRQHGNRSQALIETLHTVQETFGHLDEEALRYVASSLRVPFSRVFGVATFYHFFSLKPKGRHSCIVCLGTACYIKGVPKILKAIGERFGIGVGETTADGELSLLSARCLGACSLAPVAAVDDEIAAKLTPESALARLEEVTRHAVH
jgi:bidirectional [NiFe] hydrogenase diaphorase subunit